jgi:deoxyribonuclease V
MTKHSFQDITPREAVQLQKRLREKVVIEPLDLSRIRFVAGADLSYDISEKKLGGFLVRRNSETVFAGIVVLRFPELEAVEEKVVRMKVKFPYIPGLLSFRESPVILEAWGRLDVKPDVMLIDGHGLAHPRRFGIACHLGLLLRVPTVGCGKSLLVGRFDARKLRSRRGSYTALMDGGETIGCALRTRENSNPIFVSVGFRSDLRTARQLVLKCSPQFRIPEPTRRAHQLVNAARRGEIELS